MRIQLLKMLLPITIGAFLWAVLAALSISCESQCSYQSTPIPATVPHCLTTVTKTRSDILINTSGQVSGGGKVVIFLPAERDILKRSDYVVTEKFDFTTTAVHLGTLIPMVFLFSKSGEQYVCKLDFVHEDSSSLSLEELDNIKRTKLAADARQK